MYKTAKGVEDKKYKTEQHEEYTDYTVLSDGCHG